MNDIENPPRFGSIRAVLFGGALLAIILTSAVVARLLAPAHQAHRNQTASSQNRPIVQIVRQQPGLPDVADLVDRLCPSIAVIVARGSDQAPNKNGTARIPASVYSADGWLVTSAAELPQMPLDAVFGDGRSANVTEIRSDPVSGLAIVKADVVATPLAFNDQAFPRVGEFGLGLTTPIGNGCSATFAMIGSDFVADGGSMFGYVRLQPAPDAWASGTPLMDADGRILGIGTAGQPGEIIPAAIARVIIDELMRNGLSATNSFGFRTIDYADPFSSRLGDVRSGAGVALVQAGSSAAKAGLEAGDVITAVDARPVSSASELSRLLDAATNKARLTVHRRSGEIQLTVKRNL